MVECSIFNFGMNYTHANSAVTLWQNVTRKSVFLRFTLHVIEVDFSICTIWLSDYFRIINVEFPVHVRLPLLKNPWWIMAFCV